MENQRTPLGERHISTRLLDLLWWSAVLAFAIHNLEEWWFDVPGWSAENGSRLMNSLHSSQHQFGIAVALLTAFVLVVALMRKPSWSAEALTWFAYILLVNAGMHIVNSLLTWSLMPGVVSSVLMLLPLGVYTITKLPKVEFTWIKTIVVVVGALGLTFGSLVIASLLYS